MPQAAQFECHPAWGTSSQVVREFPPLLFQHHLINITPHPILARMLSGVKIPHPRTLAFNDPVCWPLGTRATPADPRTRGSARGTLFRDFQDYMGVHGI